MKSGLLKCSLFIGALAFINCGDDASTAPNFNLNSELPGIVSSSDVANLTLSSSSVVAPVMVPVLGTAWRQRLLGCVGKLAVKTSARLILSDRQAGILTETL